jgi:adenylate cyclase
MKHRERELAEEFSALARGKKVYTRIGINTTQAAVGFVGSSHLFNFTALGDGVNLASRLEGANKIYGTQILVSDNTASLVKELFVFRKLDTLRVKGKKQPMAVYELVAEAGKDGDTAAVREKIALYQSQQWDHAEKTLLELSEKFGQDAPATILQGRISKFRNDPPGGQWDGVYVASEK